MKQKSAIKYDRLRKAWHGLMAFIFIVLIVSGVSMQYADYSSFLLPFNLAVSIHNSFGVILIISYLFFIIVNIKSKNYLFYQLNKEDFQGGLRKQLYYYLFGMFKKQKTPFPADEKRKFNPLQKLSYFITMYFLLPIIIISGIALLFPEIIIHQIFNVSGILITDVFHLLTGFLLSAFLIIHIYMVSID